MMMMFNYLSWREERRYMYIDIVPAATEGMTYIHTTPGRPGLVDYHPILPPYLFLLPTDYYTSSLAPSPDYCLGHNIAFAG
jgi:hypothetical protein